MSRMLRAYTQRFTERLQTLGSRQTQRALTQLIRRAHRDRPLHRGSLFPTLHQLDLRLQRSALRLRRLRGSPTPNPHQDPVFLCDSGLGGLARWLRATGYQASWQPDYDDTEALRLAGQASAIFLTTDAPLMDRRIIRSGAIQAFWIAPALSVSDQLTLVRREFALPLRAPRCMACGGPLLETDPRTVWDRIPPRTRRWLNHYFVCSGCHQLFWHGTHWSRIRQRLADAPQDAA